MPRVNVPGVGIVNFPESMSRQDIEEAIRKNLAPVAEPKSGFIPSLKEGARGAFEATKRGITAPFTDEEAIRADYEAQKAAEAQRNVSFTPFSAVPEAYEKEGLGAAIGTTYDAARDALGRSLPYMAPTVAGAATGARLGALTAPVTGPFGAIVGGTLGGIAGGLTQFAGTNIERRIEEGTPGPLVTPEVYQTAAAQATLDTAATAFTLGGNLVAKIIGKPLTKVTEQEVLGLAARTLRGAGKGVVSEMPTEVAQQVLERRQAGLSLTSDDAYAEYGEAAAAAGVLGGVLGGVGGAASRGVRKPVTEEEKEKQKADVLDQDTRTAAESLGINLEAQDADTDVEGDVGDGQTADISGTTGEGVSVPSETGIDEVAGGPEVVDAGTLGGSGRDVVGAGGTESTVNTPLVDPSAQQLQDAPIGSKFVINGEPHYKDENGFVKKEKQIFNEAELQEEKELEPYATENLGKEKVAEPPVPKGFTRVYHSGSIGEGESGRWVSTNKQYASDYRADLPLFYYDIPKTDKRLTSEIEGQGVEDGFTFNFELSPEEAVKLKPVNRIQKPTQEELRAKRDARLAQEKVAEQQANLEKEKARLARVKEIKEQIQADKTATEVEGKARLEAADIAERQRKQRLYDTAPKLEPEYKKVANELYRYEKAETDKDFNELPKSQQNLETKTVGLYEANRKAAAKEMNIELPDWGRLSQDARQEFKSQIQQGKKVDSLGLASAFDKVATQLEAENVAFREFGPTEAARIQTKVQEKSALNYAQREQAVDRVIQEGRQNTWGEILDILAPTQETVPGQARVMTATPALAEKIKEVMNRIGGDVNIVYGTMNKAEIDAKRYAKFDPKTNTITIDREALANNDKSLSSAVTHEMAHYLLDHLIDNPKKTTAKQKATLKKLDDLRKNLLKVHSSISKGKELGDEYDIDNLKEFIAELMSNDGFKRDLAGIRVTDPAQVSKDDEDNKAKKTLFKYILSESPNNKGKSVLNALFEKIADLLGFNTKNAKVLEYAVTQLESILNDEAYTPPSQTMRGETVSYATKKAGEPPEATFEQLENKAYNNTPEAPKGPLQREVKWLFTEKAKLWTFREFQNDRYYLKDWQNKLEKMGKLVVGENGYNDVYNFVTLAFGKAQKLSNQYVQQPAKQLNEALGKYIEASGLDTRTALARLGLYAEALHEPERRREKYLRLVPLSVTKKAINPITGKTEAAADIRTAIYDELDNNTQLSKNDAIALHTALENLVANNKEAGGASFKDAAGSKLSLDINSSDYRVSHLSSNDVNTIVNKIAEDPESQALMDDVLAALEPLNEASIKLNQEAGYWTNQVQNYKNFYGFKHYVPYKGRPNLKLKNDDESFSNFDPNTLMLSTELKQATGGFEGRQSESQNPILQVLVEATSAAARAGRGYEYTQAIKNAVAPPEGQDKVMSGKILKHLTFAERRNMTDENKALLNKRNVILHYDPDGSVDIIEIDNAELLEAIRRPYKGSTNFLFEELNKLTSFFGQMHTRYNPSFPVLNYARDVLTNAYIMMAEGNPKMAAQFATAAAKNTLNLPKAGLIAKYYHSGNIKAIEEMAKKDQFAADMLEYIEEGGRVAYAQSLSVQSGIAELHKGVGKNGVLKTKEKIDQLFDVWTDAFELTARASAYGLIKGNYKAKGMDEKAARRNAASHVKQYANFEEVGRLGKELGAMFMFFRPAMTGAVRSIEALAPALPGSLERFMNSLPKDIDAEARETARSNFERQQRAARVAAGSLAAAGAAVYAISAMLSGSDDEDRNRVLTDDMSRWTRFARFDLGEDRVLQLPWGFGLGALPAAGAQVASMFNSYTDPVNTAGNLVQIGLDSFLPLPVSRMNPFDNFTAFLIDSITPSAVRPLYELTMNVNSFGYEIYNNRQTRISDAYIGGDNIPELYKEAAKLIYDATDGAISWSPNTMYFLMNNYVDGVSRMAHNGYGTMLTLAGEKEFDAKTDVPLFESFLSKQSNIDNRRYGELQKEVTDLRQRLKTMEERNPEALARFLEKNPAAYATVEIFDSMTGSILNDLREEANTIRYKIPDLSLKEKKELLKENLQIQSAIKRNIVENIEAIKQLED